MRSSRVDSIPLAVYKHGCAVPRGRKRVRLSAPLLVALYILEEGVLAFSPKHVRAWAFERFRVLIDRRRVYDGCQYWLEKGVLEKPTRGWYVVKDVARLAALLSTRLKPQSQRPRVRCRGRTTGGERVCVGGCCVVFRVHVMARGDDPWYWVRLVFERVVALREVFSYLVRVLRWLLRRYGWSGYRVRRVVSDVVRRVRALLQSVRVVVGGHGVVVVDERGRRKPVERGKFFSFEEILKLFGPRDSDGRRRVRVYEFGVDLLYCGGDGEAEAVLEEAYELLGSQRAYVPMPGTGSRK